MSMREKAKLRTQGWAGEYTREELSYVKGWLKRTTGVSHTIAWLQAYARGTRGKA